MTKHRFWIRFVNIDADQLREVDFRVQFVQPSPENSQTDYDTQANDVEIDVKHFGVVPSLWLFANRSKSNGGHTTVPSGDFKPLVLSPVHFSGSGTKRMETTMRGYFESTGDSFFHSKRYTLQDIRCGEFDNVDNNKLQENARSRILSGKLDSVRSTSDKECLKCPHHETCELDVALAIRRKSRLESV